MVHYGNALDAQVVGQTGDYFLGFLIVGGAQVDHAAPLGIAEETTARERSDVGDAGVLGNGDGCARGWGADGADQRENLLAFDQLAGVVDGGFRLVPIVERHQFEPASVDPALLIHLAEGRLHPEPHVAAQLLG